jgi:hypothetical protein
MFNHHELTLGAGTGKSFYAGHVSAWGQYYKKGTLQLVENFVSYDNGTYNVLSQPTRDHFLLTTGTNNISSAGLSGSLQDDSAKIMQLTIVGTNYLYVYAYLVSADPFAGTTILTLIGSGPIQSVNTAGYGAPTIAGTSYGGFSITNANYPTSGVTCDVTYSPIGWGQPY